MVPSSATAPTPTRGSTQFHRLRVSGVRPLAADAVELQLDVPPHLASAFAYLPGQHIAVRSNLGAGGAQIRRSYSLSAPPSSARRPDGGLTLSVGIKHESGGLFSSWALTQARPGDELEVMRPSGSFVPRVYREGSRAGAGPQRYVALAAGSGITPIVAIVTSLLEDVPGASVDIVDTSARAASVMYLEELADLKDRFPSRLGVHHVLTREERGAPLLSGRLDAGRLATVLQGILSGNTGTGDVGSGGGLPGDNDAAARQLPGDAASDAFLDVREWFLCGPLDLVQRTQELLSSHGVPASAIRHELFAAAGSRPGAVPGGPVTSRPSGTGTGTGTGTANTDANTDARPKVTLTFTLDGQRSTVPDADPAASILTSALRVREDVPFACAGGVCGTCRAKLVCGEVSMAENYALEPEELERGYILTCQATPDTEEVSVNYDG